MIYFKLCFGGHTESLKFHKVIRITVCMVGLLTAVARLDDFCFFLTAEFNPQLGNLWVNHLLVQFPQRNISLNLSYGVNLNNILLESFVAMGKILN